MSKALYRKYRSKSFDEVVGQEHITTTLNNALKNKTYAHAYLFTGPRGVGKTSVARIFAHQVNNLPYDETKNHIDIIEIDAASNRRIDEIRDLREKVHIAPTSAQYKVYIIDEVHMLTKEAFNALLKTLEEPPAHVIFILATTEAHKLPETIISRTQHFRFKSIDTFSAVPHLQMIADKEGITLSAEAAQLIAEHGSGSFRDSISFLDQLRSSSKTIELAAIRNALGVAPSEVITQIWQSVRTSTPAELMNILTEASTSGYQAPQLAKQLADYLRLQMLKEGHTDDANHTLAVMKELVQVSGSSQPTEFLEVILLEAQLGFQAGNNEHNQARPTSNQNEKISPKPSQKSKESTNATSSSRKISTSHNEKQKSELDNEVWSNILSTIKSKHNTLYSVVRMAQPSLDNAKLHLIFEFPFHYKRLCETKNSKVVSEVASTIIGKPIILECELASTGIVQSSKDIVDGSADLDNISNIFGGAEVLES